MNCQILCPKCNSKMKLRDLKTKAGLIIQIYICTACQYWISANV